MKRKMLATILAAMTALGASAVTTNRVTVTERSGSSSVEGSLAYWLNQAPENGDVLELTLLDDGESYLLDEPITISSGQSVIIRCDPAYYKGNPLFEVAGGRAKAGPLVKLTQTLADSGKNPFTNDGHLRFERVTIGVHSIGGCYVYFSKSLFFNYSRLELVHCGVRYGHDHVKGGIMQIFYGSKILVEGCTLEAELPDDSKDPGAVEGGIVYATGGRFTMVNSACRDSGSSHSFVFRGSDTDSLFVNCSLGGYNLGFGCSILYENVAEGKHHVVGTRLGHNPRYAWDSGSKVWDEDKDANVYQVECEGSGRPVLRDCVIENGAGYYGNVTVTNGTFELVNCVEAEWDYVTALGYEFYVSYLAPLLNGGANVYAVNNFVPYPRMNLANAGAQIWHDGEWLNVAGEDTERFALRGDEKKATERLAEDFIGKTIPEGVRPAPSHVQWNEPALTVNCAASTIIGDKQLPRAYRFDIAGGESDREGLSDLGLLWGETTLQDAIEYANEDWLGERKLLGSDGYYHIGFSDGVAGGTVDVHGAMTVREGVKIVIEGGGTTIDAGGRSRIFDVKGGELVLRNLVLKGGRADGTWYDQLNGAYDSVLKGGAVRVGRSADGDPGSVTLVNCRVEDCVATEAGGAVYTDALGCSATVKGSSFLHCRLSDASSGMGGAIAAHSSSASGTAGTVTVKNSVFAECGGSSANNDAVYLGRLFDADLSGVVMSGGEHGGICIDASVASVSLRNSVIAGNDGCDISGKTSKIKCEHLRYGSASGVPWGTGVVQVDPSDVFLQTGYLERTVDGVSQVYYDVVGGGPERTLAAGEYFKATLSELGFDVPTDGTTAYSVAAKGLPSGLKLKYNAAVKNKKGKVTKKAKVEWWIEGVPTKAHDYYTNPAYLVITVGGTSRTLPLPIEVEAHEVSELSSLSLGQTLNEKEYLAGVGKGWTVSGLPTGLKFATKKTTMKVGKKKVSVAAYSVYGKTTKAGLFTITAKKKKGSFYETLKFRVLVSPKAVDASRFGTLADRATTAYDAVDWNLKDDVSSVGGNVTKVAGLPKGLTFATKNTYAYTNAKKKTGKYLKQAGQTIVGTPTKAGTYVVTFYKGKKTAQILWTVGAYDATLSLEFNGSGGVVEEAGVGLSYGGILPFKATDGAKVTASGLPKGITLSDLGGGSYAFAGYATKAGTYLVTVKAAVSGKTVTQRLALKVDALPSWAKGTFTGAAYDMSSECRGLATMTVSSAGKVSGKFQELGTNWTFAAACYAGFDGTSYTVPVTAKYTYKYKEGKKTKKKTLTRDMTLSVLDGAFGGTAILSAGTGESVSLRQNLWGSTYKAVGSKVFYTSKKKQYRTFSFKGTTAEGAALGLGTGDTLSVKVTAKGAVTATLKFDTGKKKKGKTVYYSPKCSTTALPNSAADANPFECGLVLYFAPSAAKGFTGLYVDHLLELPW